MNDAKRISMIHAERARFVAMLAGISEQDWKTATLCSNWNVEQVVAHLSAAANTGKMAWILSMLRAGFNPAKHNQRQLEKYIGDTPEDTLRQFRNSVTSSIFPTKDYGAWLGEVIVHGQDIAHALDIELDPDPAALEQVATFYAAKDFAVNSARLAQGLNLKATDASFQHGSGPDLRGTLKDLVMSMAGRKVFIENLEGDGVHILRQRLT